ncbi:MULTISPECIES: DUF3158 family protein [Pseudomonas]|uniref:DUF3158 family protein n=1 Tax=Pseudomonas TaxID=286 RepID=UPI000B34AB45|nr:MULTISPECIES: DUF3158 family protein [Pseudomonas]PMY33078.1 DUF3158 domain-containing protein [Pseudomonas sp. GW456-L14]PMY50000.1 DUF3158 domain-containing protein [Pseudomonas sp. GW456-L12]PMY64857.1 DUF3158 domain-containing protein [Pseudomonas sp. FW305-25]PMY69222.1 DUF3158 domain-containing protein [Pseudomonas sp. FW126-L8]PNA80088.1 DUF3158 domain-containing protein [Pseudomonas sp. FW305-76]
MSPMIPVRPIPFEALTPNAYRTFEHAAFLKGLLKPFKGKGELEHLAQIAREIEAQLCLLMEAVVQQAAQPPYSLLDIRLVLQNTSAGSTFLRWRTRDFARMGVSVWEYQIRNQVLPQAVRERLHRFECDRIALNLQMSVVHSLYRQATTCAIKMDSAERLLRQFTTAVEVSR